MKVLVTRWRAEDGSLHDTRWQADAHDARMRHERLLSKVGDILSADVRNHHFTDLSEMFPHQWDEDKVMEQERFIRELSELVVHKWNELKEVID